jgi:release factor glutamine methyltransferase
MSVALEPAEPRERAAVEERPATALDRPGAPQSLFRKGLRGLVHYLAYHFVLSRSWTQTSRAAGFRLTVPPTVFHPGLFLTSETFAGFIDALHFSGMTVAEVGTGSGILALAAARAGAAKVIAVDINPNAAAAAPANALANGFQGRVFGVCGELLSPLAPEPLFDVILSSPPSYAGRPRDLADAAWFAGEENSGLTDLFDQARARLKPDGRFYLLLTSDSDLDFFGERIARSGFRAKLAMERSIFIESFLIFELTLQREPAPEHPGAGEAADQKPKPMPKPGAMPTLTPGPQP